MGSTTFTKETYLYWYELMQLLRRFEEKTGQLYGMQKIRGFCHLYIGQEALAAGCMTATRQEDPFITAYRDHGLALAKGISANSCMAELFGKATGCSKGKGGSMHFFGKKEYDCGVCEGLLTFGNSQESGAFPSVGDDAGQKRAPT